MKLLSIIGSGLILAGLLMGMLPHDHEVASSTEEMRWYTIEEVIQIKKDNPNDDKAVFIDVYTDWCGWCKRMDATTFKDERVQEILSSEYYPVKFDGEARRDIEFQETVFKYVASGRRGYHELAAALLQGKMSYPTVVFLDANMNMIQPLPGFRQANEILPILHYIGKEVYQEKAWPEFQAEWQAANGE